MAYRPGDHWMLCDVCGFKTRRSKMRRRWDGLWVDQKCYETQHPQERAIPDPVDNIQVDVIRDDPNRTGLVSCKSSSAIPGYAIPGCMIPGNPSKW